jgi:hypothetical protein
MAGGQPGDRDGVRSHALAPFVFRGKGGDESPGSPDVVGDEGNAS